MRKPNHTRPIDHIHQLINSRWYAQNRDRLTPYTLEQETQIRYHVWEAALFTAGLATPDFPTVPAGEGIQPRPEGMHDRMYMRWHLSPAWLAHELANFDSVKALADALQVNATQLQKVADGLGMGHLLPTKPKHKALKVARFYQQVDAEARPEPSPSAVAAALGFKLEDIRPFIDAANRPAFRPGATGTIGEEINGWAIISIDGPFVTAQCIQCEKSTKKLRCSRLRTTRHTSCRSCGAKNAHTTKRKNKPCPEPEPEKPKKKPRKAGAKRNTKSASRKPKSTATSSSRSARSR